MMAGIGATTIVAVATPPGQGGVGIVRMSGPDVLGILSRLFQPAAPAFAGFRPWVLHRGRVCDHDGQVLDDALAVYMPGPRSFTGEDVVELQCHGSPALLGVVVRAACMAGAQLAERGEFTRRAFVNGRMDLTQAEAVAELIAAPGPEAASWAALRLNGRLGQQVRELGDKVEELRAWLCLAVDFPDDEVDAGLCPTLFVQAVTLLVERIDGLVAGFERSRFWQEGMTVALAGPVNAGKSSLMNLLLGRERALVSPVPGTTRDYLEEPIRLGDLPVRLVDTAGLRTGAGVASTVAGNPDTASASLDPLEAQGIALGRNRAAQAQVVVLLVDGAHPSLDDTAQLLAEYGPQRTVLVWNKLDVAAPAPWFATLPTAASARVCMSTRGQQAEAGLEALTTAVRAMALGGADLHEPEAGAVVPNLRQTEALRHARTELHALVADVNAGVPWDVCSVRLDGAAAALADVTGLSTPDAVLNRIFASFCIGK